MTLDEAIKILQNLTWEVSVYIKGDEIDAMKLGIEALERWGVHRQECPICFMELLPGETKD